MSEINLKEQKCPVCGAPLDLSKEVDEQVTCEYCRAIVHVDRAETHRSGKKTVYNKDDNKPIANVDIPIGWTITNTFINYNKATLGIPYSVGLDIENNKGAIIHIETGNSFEGFGAATHLGQTQAMHTIQREFETVDNYLDEYVNEISKVNNAKIEFKEELEIPIKNYDKYKDFEDYKVIVQKEIEQNSASLGLTPNISALYCDSACRLYEGDNGRNIVLYTKEYGYMLSIGGFGSIGNGINNLMQGLNNMVSGVTNNTTNNNGGSILNKMADSGLLGGMLGKKFKSQNNQNSQDNPSVQEEPTNVQPEVNDNKINDEEQKNEKTVYYGTFRNPSIGESYLWMSDPIFMLFCPKEDTKEIMNKDFKKICSSFKLSPEVVSEHRNLKMQWEQENKAMMNNQAQAQWQNGQNLINIGQQRMMANQSYVESMMERSNRQYQSQRDSYNSRMAAQDRMRDARSEAIRGVNTYIKPDGKEVEVPVTADTAWINGKGEIVGGSVGFNPGSGWTKLERK